MSVASESFDLAALKLRSRRRRWLGRYALAAIGLGVVVFWLAVMALAPLIAPYSYRAVDLANHLLPPSWSHPLGTDELGRDVLSRVIWGARISLPTGFVVVAIGSVIGVLYGAVAAFVGGKIEEAMMRVTDLFLCFPPLILAMAIAAALGVGWTNTIIAMVVVWWPKYARVSRSLVLVQRSLEYVEAARVMGFGPSRIVLRHIMPNTLGPLTTLVTLDVGNALITFAGLGFLGLGVVPPAPEWGAMVSEGRSLILQWWVSVFPGLAIFSVVMGFNFLGDGIRDWLDPRAKRR
jgi:peptide/nickel transport system permease protein